MTKKNVELWLGSANSGKSEAVEKQLAEVKSKLYVGTLSKDDFYMETITKHQSRRKDPGWDLYELKGDLITDVYSVAGRIVPSGWTRSCMIDGLTPWVLAYARDESKWIETARELGKALSSSINDSSGDWWLLDTYPNGRYSIISRVVVEELMNRVKYISLKHYGEVKNCVD